MCYHVVLQIFSSVLRKFQTGNVFLLSISCAEKSKFRSAIQKIMTGLGLTQICFPLARLPARKQTFPHPQTAYNLGQQTIETNVEVQKTRAPILVVLDLEYYSCINIVLVVVIRARASLFEI